MQKTLLTLLINLVLGLSLWGQDSQATRELAFSQYKAANFQNAISLFNRFIYFNPDSSSSEVFGTIADCYEKLNDLTTAQSYYELAFVNETSAMLKTNWLLNKSRCALLSQSYHQALASLYSIDSTFSDEQYFLLNFYSGTCFISQSDYVNARVHFMRCIKNKTDSAEMESILLKWKSFENKSEKKAKWLSVFVPGSGQLYAGEWKAGVNSFILTGALAGLFFYVGATYSVVDAFLAVLPWFQRYYRGGYTKAPVLLKENKTQKTAERYKEILDLLSKT